MSVIFLQDKILHYEVLGRGRPLFFLHGWVGSWRYWVSNMQATSSAYRTYALDFWGFGDSAKDPAYFNIRQQTLLLEQFLQEMGIRKIAVVGHGLGAVVAIVFAASHPELVDRVMIVSCPLDLTSLRTSLQGASPSILVDKLLDHVLANETTRAESHKISPQAIQGILDSLQTIQLEQILQKLTIPCLMVYGQTDPLVQSCSQEQFEAFPDSIHQIAFEQSGHFPMLDEVNKFNRLLADFLSLGTGDSPRQLQLKEEWKRRVR